MKGDVRFPNLFDFYLRAISKKFFINKMVFEKICSLAFFMKIDLLGIAYNKNFPNVKGEKQ
jgi:hypothetical protein